MAEQAAKPACSGVADARYLFSYREMREQVVALANLLRERGVKPGDAWRWHYRARSFSDLGTRRDS
ncbi:hypothetical protein ACLK1T_04060 [Escherichia coli]